MIFCKMVGKDSFDGETGFGISTCICDNEHNLMHVYPEKKIVKEITEGGKTVNKWTFDKYLEAIFKDEED